MEIGDLSCGCGFRVRGRLGVGCGLLCCFIGIVGGLGLEVKGFLGGLLGGLVAE